MKKYLSLILPFLMMIVSSLACSEAVNNPQPTASPTASPTSINQTNVNPAEVGLTMFADKVNAEATQASVNQFFTATAQVIAITSTNQFLNTQEAVTQRARADAQATSDQARKDAQATQQRIDIEATQAQAQRVMEAQATQARMDLEATQQAEATAASWKVTEMVIPTHNLWTQQAVEQEMILATNEVELSNLSVQQKRQTNTLEWVVKYGAVVVLTASAMVFIMRRSRAQEFRNEDGDIEMVVFDNAQVVKPALLPKPVLMLTTNEMPDVAKPEEQVQVTARSQAIKALSVMPASPTASGAAAYNQLFGPQQSSERKLPVVEVVTPDQINSGILEEIEGQVVEEG